MRRKLLLFILLTTQIQANWESLPISYEGRIRPAIAYESMTTDKDVFSYPLLPNRNPNARWMPLKSIHIESENFTPYPDPLFDTIKQAYLNEQLPQLEKALAEGYTLIAGTPLQQGATTTLYYPNWTQLELEALYIRYPLTLLVIFAYTLALICRRFSLFSLAFILHTLLLAIRCFILGRPPVSNMMETVLYVPWVASGVAMGLYLYSRLSSLLIGSSLVAISLLALVQWGGWSNGLDTVQPVLNSQYWLVVHVLMVVGSYGLFALASMLGHVFLMTPYFRKDPPITLIKPILWILYAGTGLLILGTVLGGVWAAQSWGRFWDWDPKEAWAFISCSVYLLWIHAYRFRYISHKGLAMGAVIGFLFISFTWYGVNYLLGTGLHSYGFGEGGVGKYLGFIFAEMIFLALILLPKKEKMRMGFNII